MAESEMVSTEYAARLVLVASAQAAADAVRWLELIEKHGAAVLPHALKEMRAKAALSPLPAPPSVDR